MHNAFQPPFFPTFVWAYSRRYGTHLRGGGYGCFSGYTNLESPTYLYTQNISTPTQHSPGHQRGLFFFPHLVQLSSIPQLWFTSVTSQLNFQSNDQLNLQHPRIIYENYPPHVDLARRGLHLYSIGEFCLQDSLGWTSGAVRLIHPLAWDVSTTDGRHFTSCSRLNHTMMHLA